jgi:tetratricopeptide (TPR) repeat protein
MNPKLTLFPAILGLALSLTAAAGRADNEQTGRTQDPAYGLALYQYYQDRPLAAITEINVGKHRHTLARQQTEAELLLGGLYFSYGLTDEAAKIFNGLLNSESLPALRNRVWYNLARVNYQRGLPNEAETLLQRINDDLPWPHNNHRRYIETALLIASDRLDEAERSLGDIEHDSPLHRYADYNLSLRRLSLDHPAGIIGMQGIARKDSPQADMQSLSDQANLTLGIRAFSARSWDDALDHLSQVRLDGPVASEALLATGWVHQRAGQLGQALAYWNQLLRLQRGDNASREAAYAIAFSLEQSGLERRALLAYQQAAANLDAQRANLDDITARIAQGALIDALDPDNDSSNVRSTTDPIRRLDAGLRKALNELLASTELARNRTQSAAVAATDSCAGTNAASTQPGLRDPGADPDAIHRFAADRSARRRARPTGGEASND